MRRDMGGLLTTLATLVTNIFLGETLHSIYFQSHVPISKDTVMRAPLAYCIALTSSVHFSLIRSSADQQSMAQHSVVQHDEAEDESLLGHRWVR